MPKYPTTFSFKGFDYQMYWYGWITFEKYMNVAWHNLHVFYSPAIFLRYFPKYHFQPIINSIHKYLSPILGTPNDMVVNIDY